MHNILATASLGTWEIGASFKSLRYVFHISSQQKGLGTPGLAPKALLRSNLDESRTKTWMPVCQVQLSWHLLTEQLGVHCSLSHIRQLPALFPPPLLLWRGQSPMSACFPYRSSFLSSNLRASRGVFSHGPRNMASLVNRGFSTVGVIGGIRGLLHWPCHSTGRAENIA